MARLAAEFKESRVFDPVSNENDLLHFSDWKKNGRNKNDPAQDCCG
jgi:hypothetical protein